jgi:hypothetical protein
VAKLVDAGKTITPIAGSNPAREMLGSLMVRHHTVNVSYEGSSPSLAVEEGVIMQDEVSITKSEQQGALTKSPAEWLAIADDTFTTAMQRMSAALIQELDPAEVAAIHDFTKKADKSIQAFKDNSRERLLTYVLERGSQVTERGTLELDLGNGRVQRATPANTKPNDKLTERVLRSKGLDVGVWMDKEVKFVVNEVKLKELLETQQITESEYKQCFGKLEFRLGATEPKSEEEE